MTDLKRRGLLDSTLVVWGEESWKDGAGGRPRCECSGTGSQSDRVHMLDGRRRHKGGTVVGTTDDLGIHAVTDRVHFRDLHTTILNQLGLDQNHSPISILAVKTAHRTAWQGNREDNRVGVTLTVLRFVPEDSRKRWLPYPRAIFQAIDATPAKKNRARRAE